MAIAEPIVTELTIDGSGAERGQAQYVRAMDAARAAMERSIAVNARLAESYSQQGRVVMDVAAANDNAKSSIVKTSTEVLELGLKLKTLATVAYLTWPAFRNGVNLQALPALKLLHVGLSEIAPVATAVGTVMVRSLAPAFAFLTRISLPILAVIAAWKALNALIGQGADLLEKYGNASRAFDSSTVVKNLEKLTVHQDNDRVTLQQRQTAAELATRLDQAKFRLQEFMKVHFDLNNVALSFQRVWVNIVETIAQAADNVFKLIRLIGQAYTTLTGLGTQIGQKIGEAIRANLPDNIAAALTAAPGAASKGDFDVNSRARALRIARGNLSAGLGVAASGADENANIGGTFAARWSASIDALGEKAKKAAPEVAKVTTEFDRMEKSMQRAAAVQEAEAKAVDASVGEHARLRAEMRLQEAAQQDIAKFGGAIEDYSERIKVLAERFGNAAQQAAELKLKSDIQFTLDTTFLSDADKQIASILRQTFGKEWKTMMDGPIAGAMRFNNALRELQDSAVDFTKSFVSGLMAGKSVAESLSNSLENLSRRLADKAIEALLSGDFAKAAISGISAVVTFIGSKLFGDDGEFVKQVKEIQDGLERAYGFVERIVRATIDNDTLAGRLADFDLRASRDRFEELKAGGFAINQLEMALAQERLKIIRDFEEEAATRARQAEEAVNARRLSAQDRLFNAANDNQTPEGRLAAFDRQAQRERETEVAAGGQALVDLEAAQAVERVNIVRDANDEIAADARRTAQEILDAQTRAARGIVDYINSLQVGPDSSLSPSARLAAATQTANATMALAQSGNLDALARITQDVDNELKAARAFFGSAAGFQTIQASRIAQLQGLPVIATSSDPIVQALLNVTTAVQGTTTAVQNDTTTTAARLDTTIARLDTTITRLVDVVNNLSAVVGQLDFANAVLQQMRDLNFTASAQLQLLNQNFGNTTTTSGAFGSTSGGAYPNVTLSGPAIDMLRKIAFNTAAIANNTQGTALKHVGMFATGGTLPAHGLGIFGEHHPAGPFMMRAGSSPVPITPAMPPMAARGGNDNGAMLAEMRALRAEVAALKRELERNTAVTHDGNNVNRDGHAANVAAVKEEVAAIRAEARQERINPRKSRAA